MINSFLAVPYNSSVLLTWNPGYSSPSSTSANECVITIQYSTTADANTVQNTPPYAVRMMRQPQGLNNVLLHPYLTNGTTYTYSIFVQYTDTGYWVGPMTSNSVTPLATSLPDLSGSISFSKLDTNTILASNKDSKTEIVVWLSENQQSRRTLLENALEYLKPAHTRVSLSYENYYVACTTTEQFQSGSYASGSYSITEGVIKNSIPTIDSSFSGTKAIYGG